MSIHAPEGLWAWRAMFPRLVVQFMNREYSPPLIGTAWPVAAAFEARV
jgi:hypothetical protein